MPHRPDGSPRPGLPARGHPGPQGRTQALYCPQVLGVTLSLSLFLSFSIFLSLPLCAAHWSQTDTPFWCRCFFVFQGHQEQERAAKEQPDGLRGRLRPGSAFRGGQVCRRHSRTGRLHCSLASCLSLIDLILFICEVVNHNLHMCMCIYIYICVCVCAVM